MLCVIVAVGVVLGGWRAHALLAAPPDPMSLTVGDVTFRVSEALEVTGLSDADLGGMSHGVQSLVSNDRALIRVAVTVTAGDDDTTYDATGLRASATGASAFSATAPIAGSLPLRGRLAAHSHLEGSLSYVVPRNGAHIVLGSGPGERSVSLLYVSTTDGKGGHAHDEPQDPVSSGPSPPTATPTASATLGPPSAGLSPSTP
jgi:hypothetical protein